MADLILLNGPPASGKSTIAQRYVDLNPLALNLDIDVIRSLLGGWVEQPEAAGLVARALALAMAEQHLEKGNNVIVPQFLGRPEFIDQLAEVAGRTGCRFVEVGLWLDSAEAIRAFAERSAAPTTQAHRDAAELVARSPRKDPVGQMYGEFVRLIEQRPQTARVDVVRGDTEATFERFMEVLE